MTRPQVIRADTIDLQDPDAPSAKDHTRQPTRPGALGEGSPAPHQADALKHVELELSEQHGRSPRASQDLSGKELQLLHEDSDSYNDPSENLLRNSVHNSAADEDTDGGEGDESLDDDMMDKISSSPSIGDDGGYSLPLPWPSRIASLSISPPEKKASHAPEPPSDDFSSPFAETPAYFPLSFPRNEQEQTPSKDHHQRGEYTQGSRPTLIVDEYESERRDRLSPLITEKNHGYYEEQSQNMDESYEGDFDPEDFHHLLLPADDPLLDNSFDRASLESDPSQSSPTASEISWNEATGEPDDDTEDIFFQDDQRFVDSGWGGECLREIEDIDFEFVYALHTFVATVEGQANATKGDTMVLLDDVNSYWWLVRVVKDSSIGYLPAEHIETPLERLARLNKHRNLDLCTTMLGDQEEEKKAGNPLNPLKKAMRRRNVKTVQFTAPTYVEPSDVEYTSDEEEEGNDDYNGQEQETAEGQGQEHAADVDDTAIVAPLNTRDRGVNGRQPSDGITTTDMRHSELEQSDLMDRSRTSEEVYERMNEGTPNKSRKGTVRNTDSFFKDDTVETRKINLTPSLLRDDSNGSTQRTSESKELKTRASLESLEKDDRLDDDKKKRGKRAMLGGMFKRKEKKSKTQDRDYEDVDKTSSELSRQSPTPKESMESLNQDGQGARGGPQPYRQGSKLQKSPPSKGVQKPVYSIQGGTNGQKSGPPEQNISVVPEPSRAPPPVSDSNTSMRLVAPETRPLFDETSSHPPPEASPTGSPKQYSPKDRSSPKESSPEESNGDTFSPFVNALRPSAREVKPEPLIQSRQRMQMDDFDSSSSDEPTEPSSTRESHESQVTDTSQDQLAHEVRHTDPVHQPSKAIPNELPPSDRLSESPIQVPSQEQRTPHRPPPLMTDTSIPSSRSTSPESALSTPSLIEAPISTTVDEPSHAARDPDTLDQSSTSTTPTWSDAGLRAYMEDDSEIRDLLVVVHDKSGATPRRDHPVVQGLYKEENAKLGEIAKRLDGLLGDYLGRKRRVGAWGG